MDKQVIISVKTIIITILIALGVYVLFRLGPIIGILLIAVFIVMSMEPAVKRFMKFTFFNQPLSRSAAVITSYLILLVILAVVATFVIPPVVTESQKMIVNLSSLTKGIVLPGSAQFNLTDLLPQASKVSTGILSATISIFSNVTAFVSLLIFAVYMSLDWVNIKKNFISIFPDNLEDTVKDTLDEIEKSVGSWVRGELFLMFTVGFASFMGLAILGVRYALALGIISSITEAVPMIGPIIAGILAGIIGFSESPIKGIGAVALYILIQQLENNLLVPKVMAKVSGFRPLVILLALLVGNQFFGIIGAIVAVPMTMVGSIILKSF